MPSPSAPSQDRLLALVDAFEGQPILMLVDLIVDRFITGTPKRISREAPVLILRRDSDELHPGGGANAVFNVRSLGGMPLPSGIVGDDPAGAELLAILEGSGIATAGIVRRADYSTPSKTRILGGARHAVKQQIVRFDVEEPLTLTADETDRLSSFLTSHSAGCRVAVLSDYGLGTVQPIFLRLLAEDRLTCIGDSRYRLQEFVGLDGATPNQEELEAIEGSLDDQPPAVAGRRLLRRLGCSFLLLTQGGEGMMLIDGEGPAVRFPCHGTTQVADVTGAGDTVIGTFALATAAGASPLEAALLANYAGGVVVMKTGTATVSAVELRAAIHSDATPIEGLQWEES